VKIVFEKGYNYQLVESLKIEIFMRIKKPKTFKQEVVIAKLYYHFQL